MKTWEVYWSSVGRDQRIEGTIEVEAHGLLDARTTAERVWRESHSGRFYMVDARITRGKVAS